MHMTTANAIAQSVLAVSLAVSVVTDTRRHKVYNWVTWPAIALGLLLGMLGGPAYALWCIEGFGLGLALGLAFMIFFRSGAGDAKLLMVVGTLAGPRLLAYTALYGAIAALPVTLIVMWRRGVFGYTLHNFLANATMRAVGNRDVSMDANSRAGKMPYAFAIAAGVAITILIHGWMGLKLG